MKRLLSPLIMKTATTLLFALTLALPAPAQTATNPAAVPPPASVSKPASIPAPKPGVNWSAMTPEERRAFMESNRAARAAAAVLKTPAPADTHPTGEAVSTPGAAPKAVTPTAPKATDATAPGTALPAGTAPLPADPPPVQEATSPAVKPAISNAPAAFTPAGISPDRPTVTPRSTGAATVPSTTPRVPGVGATPSAGGSRPAGAGAGSTLAPTPAGGLTNIPPGSVAKLGDDELLPAGLIRFQEADLTQVLDIYGEITARTVLRPGSLPAAKINLRAQTPLTKAEGARAIEAVLALNQVSVFPVGEKFVKVIPAAQAHTGGSKPVDADKIAEFGPFVTHIYQLKYADAKEVFEVVKQFASGGQGVMGVPSSQILVLRDYAENVNRMLEMIEKVDVAVTNHIEPVVIPIKYALATDIQQVLGSLTQGGGGGMSVGGSGAGGGGASGSLGSRGRLSSGGRTFGSGSMGGGYGGTGAYGQSGLNTGMNPLGTTTPGSTAGNTGMAAARSAFAQRLGNIVRSSTQGGGAAGDILPIGMAKIIADERANSLLVFADKVDLPIITNIIAKLDVVLAQVLIETVIMEVSLGDNLEYGLNYKQVSPSTIGQFTGWGALNPTKILGTTDFIAGGTTNALSSLTEGFTYISRYSDNLDVTLRALAKDNRANVISRPRVLTSHAKEGRIFIGETRPYITGYYGGYGGAYGGYGGYGGNYSQYQQLQIGIELSILPFINSEGLVVMDIQQSIQGIKGSVSINGNDVPITSDKQASAYVAVRDQDTVILGGYISSDSQSTHAGVPILKDIPLLGALFKSNKKDKARTEMVILIRPSVLATPEAAASASAVERDLLPGIRNAEREYDQQIKKELKEFEKDNKKRSKKEKGS